MIQVKKCRNFGIAIQLKPTKSMMNILDIDLDFFLDKVPGFVSTDSDERLESESYAPWEKNEVENFLINQCGLNKEKKIPGKRLTHHKEVYYEVRNMVESRQIKDVNIDHIDAHADLGLGDMCFKYLFFNLIRKSVSNRYHHDENVPDIEKMGSGNYLLFMIANRWIKSLRYIHLEEKGDDTNWVFFKNLNRDSGYIKLRAYCESQTPDSWTGIDPYKFITDTNPCILDKEVPFETIQFRDYISESSYDYVFLTQSPSHTPVESDALIPTIMQFVDQQ